MNDSIDIDQDHQTTPAESTSLDQIEATLIELKQRVGALRAGEFDAVELERTLREFSEIAAKAAEALDAGGR